MEKIFEQLWAAQREFPPIERNAQGYGYKYTTLSKLKELVEPALEKHGLRLFQYKKLIPNTERTSMCTMLRSKEGEAIHTVDVFPVCDDPQKQGGWETYLRRYQISMLLGVVSEDDDDGARASSGRGAQGSKRPYTKGSGGFKGTGKGKAQYSVKKADRPDQYVSKIGKYKGLELRNIPFEELKSYVQYMKKFDDPSPGVEEFILNADAFIEGDIKKQDDVPAQFDKDAPPPMTDDDIPF